MSIDIILLVEDTLSLAQIYEESLRQEGYAVVSIERGRDALDFLDRTIPAAIVLDLMLPDINGMEVLRQARHMHPELPVIVVTASNSIAIAVEAMKRGASDFIVKPFPPARLLTTVRNTLERRALIAEVAELRQAMGQSQYYDFVGHSTAMQAVYRIIESVASSRAGIFIRGESGTGKELAAQAVHRASPRRAKPFVAINCGAIPHDLIESHIFGHRRGAFTGAVVDSPGAAVEADGGTLFLDEVCEMPLLLQVKLLRFLQTGEITPLGSARSRTVDVRIIAATNRDPLTEVRAGNLREDLYYRLHVIPLDMPPLREREEDIILLAQHFLAKTNAEEGKSFTSFDADVLGLFRRYDWPGNVRQLENVVRNVTILNSGETVTADMMPADLHRYSEEGLWPANQNAQELVLSDGAPSDAIKPLWLAEKEAIMLALDFTNRNMTQAAALLQVSPSTLYRKLQSWKAGVAA